jgi:hypothetical protein
MRVPDRMKQTIRQVGEQATVGAEKVVNLVKGAHAKNSELSCCAHGAGRGRKLSSGVGRSGGFARGQRPSSR